MTSNLKTWVLFLAVVIAMIPPIGCELLATGEESATAAFAPESEQTLAASSQAKPRVAGSSPVIIKGDLASVNWKSMVGQRVAIEGQLEVVDTYNLVRYGEVKVARHRLHIPTTEIDPNDADPDGVSFQGGSNVAKVVAAQKYNDNAVLTIDDGLNAQDVFPPKLFPELGSSQPTVRIGSVINGVSGRIVEQRNTILLISDGSLKWTPAKRPERPDVGAADITVASFNVLNYFTTIDNGSNNARGADSPSEHVRQEAKIVSAITALQADVVGLMEIENKAGAEQQLVAALNKTNGGNVFKGCGIPAGLERMPGGSDAIRVAIFYRADRVSPVGEATLLRDNAFFSGRTPIVQKFQSKQGGKPFTVIVNHFKSKGGASDAEDADKNKGDGQSAYNATRRAQALAIVKFVDGLAKTERQPRVLILGDLNAYQQEDPIDALRAGGLVDLVSQKQSSGKDTKQNWYYSFVYFGQSGSLDHAFATEALAQDVTGVATWHINADEPRFLDYNEENNPQSLFKADPFRSSDHDPVLIGIRM